MDISTASTLNGTTGSAAASKSLADNFDTFLSLLTTQLQNQDPLEPLDTNEFTDQLVQFTEVEQGIATNENLELLISLNEAARAGSAVSYLGQDVVADGSTARLDDDGATWHYDLSATAAQVDLTVVDENNVPVFKAEGGTGRGDQSFTWDGRDNAGNPVPKGLYALQVNARDAAGNSVIAETTIRGTVSAVDFTGADPSLTVNGVSVPVSKVREVATAA
ncbi:MAG: flagellar hook assembly protein FlgD [Alphaproteobacteria bacterium]